MLAMNDDLQTALTFLTMTIAGCLIVWIFIYFAKK